MPVEIIQIANGHGAGNIGDELMAHAFWRKLPESVILDVCLFPESHRQRLAYPPRFRYTRVEEAGIEIDPNDIRPGLLLGTTLVTEAEGTHWPLQFLARRLAHFHNKRLPVHAVGVGVDRLHSAEARGIFREAFLPVRSWSVRSERCRESLLDLGVPEERILVCADLGWMFEPEPGLADWAKREWTAVGVDPWRPLIVADIVSDGVVRQAGGRDVIASALDEMHGRGFQIGFLANDCREGEYFDHASALDLQSRMNAPLAILPNEYYSPAEAIALLARASATISERYHFTLESILAGTVPVCLPRGQKMAGLCEDLGIEIGPPRWELTAGRLVDLLTCAAQEPELRNHLAKRRIEMKEGAGRNVSFFEREYLQPSANFQHPNT